MGKEGFARVAFAVIVATALSACVTLPANSQRSPQDPWESWNRGVYKFNDVLDRAVAKPVARTYVRFVPQPIRTGVTNFFANLDTPTVMVNDALQGKLLAAANDLQVNLGWTVQTYNAAEALPNLINPFWMLPLLGIMKLKARDVVGYGLLQFLVNLPIVFFLMWLFSHTLPYVPPIVNP